MSTYNNNIIILLKTLKNTANQKLHFFVKIFFVWNSLFTNIFSNVNIIFLFLLYFNSFSESMLLSRQLTKSWWNVNPPFCKIGIFGSFFNVFLTMKFGGGGSQTSYENVRNSAIFFLKIQSPEPEVVPVNTKLSPVSRRKTNKFIGTYFKLKKFFS